MKLYCIPNVKELEEYIQISEEKQLAFEYNDFFSPHILDDVWKTKEILRCYQSINRDRSRDTLHGVFLDITVHSSDTKIVAVSDERIHQSMEVAEELGVRAVIFHTNLIPQLRTASYEESWLERNEIYWRRLLEEYPKREIYIENMFDYDARMITVLASRLQENERFGICYDLAHANISPTAMEVWAKEVAPYVRHLHINDNDGIVDSHEAIGDGNIPWEKLSGWRKQWKHDPSILIEVAGCEKLRKSLQRLEEYGFYEKD